MKEVRLDEHTVRKYLLGELAVDEREQIEERLLTDDTFFNNLTVLEEEVEDELIDEYVSGDLTAAERENFERIFLSSPERNDKLNLARDLRERVAVPTAASVSERASWWLSLPAFLRFQNPLTSFSLALMLLLMSACGLWLYFKSNRLETELRQTQARIQPPDQQKQAEQLRARNDELAASLRQSEEKRAELEKEVASLSARIERAPEGPSDLSPGKSKMSPPQSRSAILSLILPLARGRGSQGEKVEVLNLSHNYTGVRLALSLESIDPRGYRGFQAKVENRAEIEVWKSPVVGVRREGGENRVVLTVPASRLSADGDYTVTLNGLTREGLSEPVGMYLFRVIRK